MPNPEQSFKYSVHRYLEPHDVDVEGMANPYRRGTPDNWYSGNKADLWVEWKFLRQLPPMIELANPKKKLLSPLQQHWLQRKHDHGRNVAVILGAKDGGLVFPGTSWQEPISREDFLSRIMKRREIAEWILEKIHE